jgi:hypothetical protein
VHTPATHVAPAEHVRPHAPQLLDSVARERHVSAQLVCPAGHTTTQAPLTHERPAAHALPHAPQFVALAAMFTSQPLAAARSQSAKPAAHAPTTHAPLAQACVATLASAQALPHAPQCRGSKLVLVHAPPQVLSPAPQVVAQTPAEQTCPA